MSSSDRYERSLPTLLDELAAPRTPVYFDDILRQVGRTRQRPGWSFIERWLPMSAVSGRLAIAPRIPIRGLIVAALLVVAIAVAAVLIAGSQRHLPAPFGPASNGLVAFVDSDGAIRTGDFATGTSAVVVAGAGHSRPVFSPDGTQLVYLKERGTGGFDIVTSLADGSHSTVLTPDAYATVGYLGWMPDGSKVVAAFESELVAFDPARVDQPTVITDNVQTRFSALDDFNPGLSDLFRPPTGDEILYVASSPGGFVLYRQKVAGGEPIAVLTAATSPTRFSDIADPQWSPDGKQIAVTLRYPNNPDLGRLYVMNADGSQLHRVSSVEIPGVVIDEEHAAWSPDGTQIAFMRWNLDKEGNNDVRPVTIVNLASGAERELQNLEVNGFRGWAWSPDGTSLIEVADENSQDVNSVLLVNAATGKVTSSGWMSSDAVSFQRVAR